MEVFTACLKKATSSSNFQFHWKTKELAISHLIFADDVMLFSRGDQTSISTLLRGVSEFSDISGLHVNKEKSLCFFANVDDNIRNFALVNSGFHQGTLPFKYLGLPLITKKLSLRDCYPLLQTITSRIESWVNKTLNHAGRLQLLKVVLFGLQGFWSAHLFLPKSVLKRLQTLFTKFLWSGNTTASKQVKVSWHDCCLPKSEGGLGIKDLCDWNRAAFLFHLWRITQPDNMSLWIVWFKRVFLKRKALWTMAIPGKTAWCIKKILQSRPVALRYMRYHVGVSSQFSFWHDPWVKESPLLNQFNAAIISVSESTEWAKVGDFISNRSWSLPPSNHTWVIDLRRLVSSVRIHASDSITWSDVTAAQVSISTIWNSIRSTHVPPPWTVAVWHSLAVPKCSFTLWLALKNRLLTKERMVHFGMNSDLRCVLCNNAVESNWHIFSTCIYINEVLADPSFSFTCDWDSYLNGQFVLGRPSSIKKLLSYLFLAVVVYYVWKERNDRVHTSGHSRSARVLQSMVKRLVREKVHSMRSFQQAVRKDNSLVLTLY